ncbi:hypothetical protein IHE44_0007338 [Lamprotornis superbus]|uniref:mitogen-activated protein kinase n=1 Tax=Lamprotornis superbus TaxID=245042 RepID=A0A835NZC3_9PASS|nr:hypothetical protein IHE44_0007338 [Lamprotornis superbus]
MPLEVQRGGDRRVPGVSQPLWHRAQGTEQGPGRRIRGVGTGVSASPSSVGPGLNQDSFPLFVFYLIRGDHLKLNTAVKRGGQKGELQYSMENVEKTYSLNLAAGDEEALQALLCVPGVQTLPLLDPAAPNVPNGLENTLVPCCAEEEVSNGLDKIRSGSVTDPRDGKRVALKKMPNVFQNLVSCKRVFRELKMLCFFKHDNVLSALDILQPPHIDYFEEIYVVTELMQSDLHKIIVSPQPLSSDHVKVFLYQILRGLKYLHSAGILHRDIKPGNLLVNSNCVLKVLLTFIEDVHICDFGLARVEELDESRHMTQEVVTQYYRAPEILMGSRHYSNAIDIWSLDLITDLLGTPSLEAMRTACEGAKAHILRGPHKQPSLPVLYTLSSQATHEAVHLLCRMLVFDPSKRISAKDALAHPYLDEGRLRYHTCMCKCCFSTSTGRVYTSDFEPITNPKFDDTFEKNLSSVRQVKEIIHQFILEQQKGNRVPLCINPQSAAFKSFISSTVAQPSEMPPSPLW